MPAGKRMLIPASPKSQRVNRSSKMQALLFMLGSIACATMSIMAFVRAFALMQQGSVR
jgi:hypothetical protein